jgi:hypothetical protein
MEITKVCKKCLLSKPVSLFYNNKGSKSGKTARCKNCIEIARRSYTISEQIKLKRYEYTKKFREKHPEIVKLYLCNSKIKRKESFKKSYEKNKDAYIKRSNARSKLLSSELDNKYIIFLLRKIIPKSKNIIIPQELIELKRIQIKTHRLCQQLQN